MVLFDFMFFIADVFTMGVQYGTRKEMCEILSTLDFDKDPIGTVAQYAELKKVTFDQYAAYNLTNTTVDFAKSERQWAYMYCTQFGWF
jgi:hypothetical protein